MNWKFSEMWNAAAISEQRPLLPRDYIYASEIMYPKIDRFLKMRAVQPSDPPNDRSRRKFFAGHVWEFVVKQVLLTCGIYRHEERKADGEPYKGLLSVHGRYDFFAGGLVDKEAAIAKITENGLPDFLLDVAKAIIDKLDGQTLDEKILEIKSVSMYALDYVESRKAPMDTHLAQGYHYSRFLNLPASICYVSKDTALMAEFDVDHAAAEKIYAQDIAEMTYYFTKGIQPAPEPLMGFDESIGKFKKNLGVEYSPYLSMIYGFANPDEYRRAVDPTTKRWNTVLGRYVKAELGVLTPTGKPMNITPKNKEVREEILNTGYDFNYILETAMKFSNLSDETEEEI